MARSPRKRPNILVFVMDTQRAANMGCYGYSKPTTPNIDAIAREGTVFLNNISPAIWTLPSHASLWTGKYVSAHGCHMRHQYLEPEAPTLPEILTRAGYDTVGICQNVWAGRIAGNARGFTEFFERPVCSAFRKHNQEDFDAMLRDLGEEFDKSSLLHVTLAMNWLACRRSRRPFFMFINSTEPHMRNWPPEPYRSRFLPRGVSQEEADGVNQNAYDVMTGTVKIGRRQSRIVKALKDGDTATLDARMGILFDDLRRKGLLDDTVIVVASDHGDESGEHLPLWSHSGCVYNTLIHVPLVIRYPRRVPCGKRLRRLTQTHDLFPTLLELAGVRRKSLLEEGQAVNLLNHFRGGPTRTFALAEHERSLLLPDRMWRQYPDYDVRGIVYRSRKALLKGGHKYVWCSDGHDELYDLREDPGEQRNLAPRDPRRLGNMRAALEKVLLGFEHCNYPDYFNESPEKRAFPEHVARMRAWGLYNDRLPEHGRPRL